MPTDFVPAGVPPRRPITEGIFLAPVQEDVVVLDTRVDAYSCLPDLADSVRIVGGEVAANPEVLDALVQAGILSREPSCRHRTPLPNSPTSLAQTAAPTRNGITDIALFWLTVLRAGIRLQKRPLRDLLAEQPPRSIELDIERIAGLTTVFVAWLPWVPWQGACLYRAYVLRSLLRAAGQDARWVFGVRTWPFSAHCWLQVGDLVLDDDLDRVATYKPIMAA